MCRLEWVPIICSFPARLMYYSCHWCTHFKCVTFACSCSVQRDWRYTHTDPLLTYTHAAAKTPMWPQPAARCTLAFCSVSGACAFFPLMATPRWRLSVIRMVISGLKREDCHYKMCNIAILYTLWLKVLQCFIMYVECMPILSLGTCLSWTTGGSVGLDRDLRCTEGFLSFLPDLWWLRTLWKNKHMGKNDRPLDYIHGVFCECPKGFGLVAEPETCVSLALEASCLAHSYSTCEVGTVPTSVFCSYKHFINLFVHWTLSHLRMKKAAKGGARCIQNKDKQNVYRPPF